MVGLRDKPLVTTIIPTYRRPQLLRRAILSVLSQTYPNVRVCVYDNASGDETEAVVAHLARKDSRVKYHCHPENVGSYNNFNFGIQNADTPFFSLLSDDDMLAPKFYEQALKGFEKYPRAMFSVLNSILIDKEKRVLSGPVGPCYMKFYDAGVGFEDMARVSIPNTWTGMVFRKEVVDLIGGVDVNAGPFADSGFVLHAAARFPFVTSPEIGGVLMAHPASTSGTMQAMDGAWPGWWERMIKKIEADSEVPQFAREKARRLMSPDLKRVALYKVARELGECRPDIAEKSATGLNDCGYRGYSMLLKTLIWGYRKIPLVRNLLQKIKAMRRRKLAVNIHRLTQKYRGAIQFMEEVEEV